MKNESPQRLAKLGLQLLVLACLVALITLGYLQLTGRSEIPSSFLNTSLIAVVVAIFGLCTFSRAGFTLSKGGLTVGRPFGDYWITYHSITRIERICRNGARQGEKVRISFMESGEEKVVEITPENSTLLIHDVLAHCPHINQSRSQKLKRSGNFRGAKEALSQTHPKSPPVEY